MPNQKKDPRSGELIFRTDIERRNSARSRYFRHAEDRLKLAKQAEKAAGKKRTASAKKGAEGPKQSKPGGYSMTRPKADTKKKRRV